MYQNQVEDYKTSEGEKVLALKVDWLSKLPRVLCMQFNRVRIENGNAVKVNHQMNIEPVVYADRFMIENREHSEKLRKHVQNLRDKIKHLEKCLNEYNHFEGSDYNISKVLGLASDFFGR